MQMIHFVHFICLSFTSFALTVLYVFMLQYLALNEQAFCFSVVSSFVLRWSDIQMFLQIGGTVHLSAPSYLQIVMGLAKCNAPFPLDLSSAGEVVGGL